MRFRLMCAVLVALTSQLSAAPPTPKSEPKSDLESAIEKAKKEKKHIAMILNLFG